MKQATYIANELQVKVTQVENTLTLLAEGASIPFIARYRKERTGMLDEVQIEQIANWADKLAELEKRRKTILESISAQDKLTPDLRTKIEGTMQLTELEDLYLPYKPKRKTRASIAKDKGLEPLATLLMKQGNEQVSNLAEKYINEAVGTSDDALQGARDIVAEWITENEVSRNAVRLAFQRDAIVRSKVVKGKEEEGEKYKDYFDFTEKLKRIASHRLLALRRGEKEGVLRVGIAPDGDFAVDKMKRLFVKNTKSTGKQMELAVEDAYKRLLQPSIETEFGNSSKTSADQKAIEVFAENLRQLLLTAPLGGKRILAIDPGYRTGCKLVCLDEKGDLKHNETIFPHPPKSDRKMAAKKVASLVDMYKIEAIAVGNGTASRETENFVRNLHYAHELQIFVVSEAGASIYSASKIAREEFPQYDVTVRGAVSIGRRLMDPLAELVKIEAKSLGVGQYQHDVDQKALNKSLDFVVESCVNKVGVDLNTASKHLLNYVSGLGPQLAKNIVEYRSENGAFTSRKQLMKVPRMGAKTFEQSAGFLRIRGAKNPLDYTAVHPEAYALVEKMAADQKVSVAELISDKEKRAAIKLENYVTSTFGLPTLKDILTELEKPGRDPRETVKVLEFDQSLKTINDLNEGMVVPGIVTNVTNFGAFVDIGIKQNGLIHISQLREGFVSDPTEVIKLHQHLTVKIMSVDKERKRIQLTLRDV